VQKDDFPIAGSEIGPQMPVQHHIVPGVVLSPALVLDHFRIPTTIIPGNPDLLNRPVSDFVLLKQQLFRNRVMGQAAVLRMVDRQPNLCKAADKRCIL